MNQTWGPDQQLGELYIRPVIDTGGDELGWAVCVLVAEGQDAVMLVLRHCACEAEAFSVKQGILDFLRQERQMVVSLASPKEFWEWNASTQKSSGDVWWTVLERDALTSFRADRWPVRCTREEWHPDGPDSLTHWLDKYFGLKNP